MWAAASELHDDYLAAAEGHPDELPIVELAEVTEIKTAQGVIYAPRFEIASWTPRPRDLPATAAPRRQPPPKQAAAKGTMDDWDEPPARKAVAPKPHSIPANLAENAPKSMDDEIPF